MPRVFVHFLLFFSSFSRPPSISLLSPKMKIRKARCPESRQSRGIAAFEPPLPRKVVQTRCPPPKSKMDIRLELAQYFASFSLGVFRCLFPPKPPIVPIKRGTFNFSKSAARRKERSFFPKRDTWLEKNFWRKSRPFQKFSISRIFDKRMSFRKVHPPSFYIVGGGGLNFSKVRRMGRPPKVGYVRYP